MGISHAVATLCITKNKNCVLYRVNGMEDHVHILFSLHPTIALSDFMRDLKAETSKILKRTAGFERLQHGARDMLH